LSRDPSQIRVLAMGCSGKSYLYVQDCINGMLKVISTSTQPVNIYNLGAAEYCNVNDSLGWISEKLKVNPTRSYTGGERGWIGDSPFSFSTMQKCAAWDGARR